MDADLARYERLLAESRLGFPQALDLEWHVGEREWERLIRSADHALRRESEKVEYRVFGYPVVSDPAMAPDAVAVVQRPA